MQCYFSRSVSDCKCTGMRTVLGIFLFNLLWNKTRVLNSFSHSEDIGHISPHCITNLIPETCASKKYWLLRTESVRGCIIFKVTLWFRTASCHHILKVLAQLCPQKDQTLIITLLLPMVVDTSSNRESNFLLRNCFTAFPSSIWNHHSWVPPFWSADWQSQWKKELAAKKSPRPLSLVLYLGMWVLKWILWDW